MQNNSLRNQRGAVIPLVIIMLLTLLVFVGLGIDVGHFFVNNTRSQNAMDATALSAAITLMNHPERETNPAAAKAAANAAGRQTFDTFIQQNANNELSGLNSAALTFEYSKYLLNFGTVVDPPAFVRVSSANTPLLIDSTFLRVVFPQAMSIVATAVAGAMGQNCDVSPFVLCADMDPDDPSNKVPLDEDCESDSDGDGAPDCYGYNLKESMNMLRACFQNTNGNTTCQDDDVESGNFGLLDLDGLQGGKDIREALAGKVNACTTEVLNTKPGYTWGNVKMGIEERFDADKVTTEYFHPTAGDPGIDQYTARYETGSFDNTGGIAKNRIIAVPIGDCRGRQNGNSEMPLVGWGCLLLTEKPKSVGSDKTVFIEFFETCPNQGAFSPTNPVLFGPYEIVLFKNEDSPDS